MKHRTQIQKIKAQNGEIPSALPKLLFVEDLAMLSGLSVATIWHYSSNPGKNHRLPRFFKLPGTRRLAFLESDVIDWIKVGHAATSAAKRPPGRPTKREQIARGAA